MWILGLLFIICLTFAGFFTVCLIIYESFQDGQRGMSEIEESKKRGKEQDDWNAYLDRLFPK